MTYLEALVGTSALLVSVLAPNRVERPGGCNAIRARRDNGWTQPTAVSLAAHQKPRPRSQYYRCRRIRRRPLSRGTVR